MNNLPASRDPDYLGSGSIDDSDQVSSPFHLQRLLGFLLKFWWIALITLILGLSVAVAFVYFKPPTFVSRARMWETLKVRLPEGSLFSEDVQTSVGTQTELLQSTRLREETLLRLRTSSNSVVIAKGRDGEAAPITIHIAQSTKSSVFTLEASGAEPAYVVGYLNALMEVYLDYKRTVRRQVSGDTLASISEQVQKSERDLKEEQNALLAFQRTNNLAILQEEGTISGGYLARLKTQLSDLQLEDRLLKASSAERDRSVAATNTPPLDQAEAASAPSSVSAADSTTEKQEALKEFEVLRIQRERLSKNLKPKHPKIVKLDAEIERAQKLLEVFRRQSQEQLVASTRAIQLKIENIRSSIQEWESRVVAANVRIAEAERLKLSVQQKQLVCDRLNLLLQNVGISRNIDQETLSILENASPAKRTYTREIGVGLLGGLGGLVLGVVIILLIAIRDDRFTSAVEVNEKFGDSVVAQVPEIVLNGSESSMLLGNGEDRHAYAESYRNLRSALMFLAVEGERPKVILVTSALPNEGKSTVSANLAHILALGGAKVLLVDADLRRGGLHKLMGLQESPGLSELFQKTSTLDQVLQTNSMPNLQFISAGARLTNPGDHFLSASLDELLDEWRKQFDYVVIDCTPVFAADDATTLAPKAEGTLFVVRNRFSGARQVREALDLLTQRRARILGVVFNRADASHRSYHYYKYAEYYGNGQS